MQKRVLACLLASPLALNALADITVNGDLVNGGEGWDQSGVSGVNIFNGTGVNCPMMGGVLNTSLTVQNPGTYKIAFTNPANIKVSVTVNGKTVEAEGNVEFEVTEANTTVALKVESADKINGFSFEKAELVVVVNFDEIRTTLEGNLNAINPIALPELDTERDAAKSLWSQYNGDNGLKAQWDALAANVAKVTYVDAATDLKVYNEFQLWKTPNTIQAAIDALKPTVETYNEGAEAETNTWNQIVKPNLDKYAALQADLTELENNLNTQKKALDEANGAVTEGAWKDAYTVNMQASNEAYAAAVASYAAFKNAVDAAFPAPQYNLDKFVVEFESQKPAVQEKIDAVATALNDAKAQWDAYKVLINLQAQLSTAATDVNTALDKIDTESNDVYNTYIATQKLAVNKIYNDALNTVTIKTGDPRGAVAAQDGDTQIINDAITAIQNVLTQTQQKIQETDQAYKDAMANVKALQDELNKVRVLYTLPEDQQKEFQALVKAAQDLINALKAKIEAGYTAKIPAIPDYTEDVDAINEAIQAVKDFNVNWAPIAELWSMYNGLQGYVKQQQQESEIKVDEFDLNGKFAGTYTTIMDAINALGAMIGAEDFSQEAFDKGVKDVKESIEKTKSNASTLMTAYKEASVAVKDFKGAIDTLDKDIKGKLIVKGSTWTADAFKNGPVYTALVQTLSGFQANLSEAAAANAQDAYAKATELQKAIEEYGWQVNVREVTEAFEVASTQVGNYNAVDNAIKALKVNAGIDNDEVVYDGKDTLGLDALDTELKAAKDAIDALVSGYTGDEDVDTKAWSEIDKTLNELLGKVDAKNQEVNKLKDNQKAYDELMNLFAPSLQDALDALIQYNQDYSLTPAKEYYANLINGEGTEETPSLQKQHDALEAEIDKALKEDRNVKELQAKLTGKINNLSKAISDMKLAIQANNSNHDAQLVKSDEVRKHIQGVIEYIENNDKGGLVPTWKEDLEKLMNDDLANVDLDVNKFYSIGQSAKENASLIKRYEEIMAKADQYKAGFDNVVEDTNNTTIAGAEWADTQKQLNGAYDQAIRQYNEFFGLSNKDYREYILKVVKTHEIIYQYSEKIAQLLSDVKSWVADNNKNKVIFTEEDFNAVATTPANALIGEIGDKVKAMMTDANEAAQQYYGEATTGIYPKAKTAITDADDAMIGAEISEEIRTNALTVANNDLASMQKLYKGTPADGETPAVPGAPDASDAEAMATSTFCLIPMDNIANIYDHLMQSINVEKAAHDQWDQTYKAAEKTLDDLTEQLKKIVDAGDPSIETLAGYVAEADALNTTATSDTELISNLVDDTAEINRILAAAKALVDGKQDAFDKDQANKDAAKEYALAYDGLNGDLEALKAFAASVAGGAGYNFGAIEGLIAYFEELYTKTYPTTLVANKAVIDAALANAQNAIVNGYADVKTQENVALQTLLADTKVAFNNAKVIDPHTLTDAELAEINIQIDKLETEINNTLGAIAVPDKKDDYSATARKLEKGLSDIYVKLMSSYESQEGVDGGDPLPGIIAELNAKHAEVMGVIDAAKADLAKCLESVQEEFAGRYEALVGDLKGIQTTYTNEGSTLVVTKDRYVAQMEAVKAAVSALLAEVQDAEAKAQIVKANNDAFVKLGAELDGYQAQLDALKAEAKEHGVLESIEGLVNNIEFWIGQDREWLTSQHEDGTLNAESTLNNANDIAKYLNVAIVQSEFNYVVNVDNATWEVLNVAYIALGQNLVPEVKAELEAKLDAIKARLNEAEQKVNDAVEKFNTQEITGVEFRTIVHEVVDELNSISEAATAVQTDADENTFVLGDVNLEPDGEVNVVDVQILINWVGEDMTYQKLYEENARQACAADVTGGKDLNIADVTKLISMVINQGAESNPNAAPTRVPRRTVAASQGVYGMEMVSSEGTGREYVMALTGVNGFVGAQIDVNLPAGMTLEGVELADASTDHEIAVFDNGSGNYRLVIASMTNSTVNAVDGVMLRIHTTGIGTPEMENVIFADEMGNAEQLKKGGSSAIENIINDARNLRDRIYDVSGKVMRKIQKGINIIRHSNGKTTKEMH